MVKKLMLAIAVVALAAPAFAAVQNVKVGGDIVTTSIIRDNFGKTGTGATYKNGKQNDVLAQTRVIVNADLTDNVSTEVSLLNENLWGGDTSSTGALTNTVIVQNANVTMKEFMYAPLTLKVGRQGLAYGNKLIIGNSGYVKGAYPGTNGDLTYSTGFDAIKAVLAYDPLTIDLFAARVANGSTGTGALTNNIHDKTNLYGINANYKMGDKMSTVVEGYVFAKTQDKVVGSQSQATYVPGLRVSTNPIEGLNVQLEGAYEYGRVNTASGPNDNRTAFALQGGVNYALPVLKDMKPVLGMQYTYLSGAAYNSATPATNGKNWDPMYMDQNAGRIFYALGFDTGVQRAELSAEITPVKDLTAKASATGIWNVTRAVNSPDATSRYRGTEADLDLTYAYTEDVKFGVSAGYFMTGKAYAPGVNNDTKNASQLLSSVSVAF